MRYIDFDSVRNYHQRQVYQVIMDELADSPLADMPGALEDVACLALNQLPPRYVRHTVDTAFYIGSAEQAELAEAIRDAVRRAAKYVSDNPRRPHSGELPRGELPA